MMDLERAAAELTAAVTTTPPDVAGVRARAGRRRRRRLAAGGFAALVLLAGGAAAIAATTDGRAHDDVRTGPGPTEPAPTESEPTPTSTPTPATVPSGDGGQLLDVGEMRLVIPASWAVQGASVTGGCGGPQTVVVGEVAANVLCSDQAVLRVLARELDDDLPASSSHNGIPTDGPIVAGVGSVSTVHLPTLDITLEFAAEIDAPAIDAILETIAPSARHAAIADLGANAPAGWQMDRDEWRPIAFDGVVVQVPRSWPTIELPHDTAGPPDACAGWATGPSAASGPSTSPSCTPTAVASPIDGVWLLPLEGTTAVGDDAVARTTTVGQEVRVLEAATGTVLEVIVPARGDDPAVLVRIGLGVDGHLAGAIANSISRVEGPPDPGPEAIVLPCGPLVVGDQANIDLPEDLQVDPVAGLGGGASDDPDLCAVHLTSTTSPGRHITFAKGTLPFGYGEVLSGISLGNRNLRWGTIHEGYGGELDSGIDGAERIYVLAYGIDEEEAADLFTSLGLT